LLQQHFLYLDYPLALGALPCPRASEDKHDIWLGRHDRIDECCSKPTTGYLENGTQAHQTNCHLLDVAVCNLTTLTRSLLLYWIHQSLGPINRLDWTALSLV